MMNPRAKPSGYKPETVEDRIRRSGRVAKMTFSLYDDALILARARHYETAHRLAAIVADVAEDPAIVALAEDLEWHLRSGGARRAGGA